MTFCAGFSITDILTCRAPSNERRWFRNFYSLKETRHPGARWRSDDKDWLSESQFSIRSMICQLGYSPIELIRSMKLGSSSRSMNRLKFKNRWNAWRWMFMTGKSMKLMNKWNGWRWTITTDEIVAYLCELRPHRIGLDADSYIQDFLLLRIRWPLGFVDASAAKNHFHIFNCIFSNNWINSCLDGITFNVLDRIRFNHLHPLARPADAS